MTTAIAVVRDIWTDNVEPMLGAIAEMCAPLSVGGESVGTNRHISLDWPAIALLSGGLSFRSDTEERRLLYERREEIFQEWGLGFDDNWSKGLLWSGHPETVYNWYRVDANRATNSRQERICRMGLIAIAHVGGADKVRGVLLAGVCDHDYSVLQSMHQHHDATRDLLAPSLRKSVAAQDNERHLTRLNNGYAPKRGPLLRLLDNLRDAVRPLKKELVRCPGSRADGKACNKGLLQVGNGMTAAATLVSETTMASGKAVIHRCHKCGAFVQVRFTER